MNEERIINNFKTGFDTIESEVARINRYIHEKEDKPLNKYNIELIRVLNIRSIMCEKIRKSSIMIKKIICIDDTINKEVVTVSLENLKLIDKSLKTSCYFIVSLKDKLKKSGVTSKQLLEAIQSYVNRLDDRCRRLQDDILPEYINLTKWGSYNDYLKRCNKDLVNDISEYLPDLSDINVNKTGTPYDGDRFMEVQRRYKQKVIEYIENMESKIDVSGYKPENNTILNYMKREADKRKEEREAKEKTIEIVKMQERMERLEIFGKSVERSIRARNADRRFNNTAYEAFKRRIVAKQKEDLTMQYAILACIKYAKNGNTKFVLKGQNCQYTEDIGKSKIYIDIKELNDDIKLINSSDNARCIPIYLVSELYN